LDEPEAKQQEAAADADAGAQATNGSEQSEAQPKNESAAGAQEAPAQQTTPDLTGELERERDKATDYMNRWQRAQADLANYRRRAEQEREQERNYALAPLLLELLKIQDNFHRAFDTLPVELREFSWVQGVALTYAHIDGLLRLYGVSPIETKVG